jgi:hypothetical protein
MPPAPKYGMPPYFSTTPLPTIKYEIPTTPDVGVLSPEVIIAILGAALLFVICVWAGLKWLLNHPGDKK